MPPCLDIYVLSERRELDVVTRFLREFAHPSSNEDRCGEELMLIPLAADREPTALEDYDWEPISTLSQALRRGLETPYRGFRLYLKPRDNSIYQAMLGFRADGNIVFGLSIDDEEETEATLQISQALLMRLVEEYDGIAGFVACEVPAPLHGVGFPPSEQGRVVCSWRRGAA